jgi:hypothetical protein
MPDWGRYEKVPRPESTAYFLRLLRSKDFISSVEERSEQVYVVHRPGRGDLVVYLTNIYIVSVADVHEILADCPDANAIVTMSEWNSYSDDAKSLCLERDVGLFKFREFLGAIYYKGERFVGYAPPRRN